MDDHTVKYLEVALRRMPPDAPVLVREGDALRPLSLGRPHGSQMALRTVPRPGGAVRCGADYNL
jgi:hypothetical protein